MFFRKNYLDWETYRKRVMFLSDFYFQQDVRKSNIRKLES